MDFVPPRTSFSTGQKVNGSLIFDEDSISEVLGHKFKRSCGVNAERWNSADKDTRTIDS